MSRTPPPPKIKKRAAKLNCPRRTRDAQFRQLPSLLFALEAAILELSNWVEPRGSSEVADNMRALETIDRNEEFIKMTLAVLMTPECPRATARRLVLIMITEPQAKALKLQIAINKFFCHHNNRP